jgi:catechol 2,3-dioxygenase-like lactoylglutathione lyase family enzyme
MEIGAITFLVKDMKKMVTFYQDVMNMAIGVEYSLTYVSGI